MTDLKQKDGQLPEDGNRERIMMASRVIYQDGTLPTALESPITVTDSITELKIPDNCPIVTLTPQGADLDVGRDATLTAGFTMIPAGLPRSFEVVDQASLFLRRNAGVSVTLFFDFAQF